MYETKTTVRPTSQGEYHDIEQTAPTRIGTLKRVLFYAKREHAPTAEQEEQLERIPEWLLRWKGYITFGGVVFLIASTIERTLSLELNGLESVALSVIIMLLGGGVETSFYFLSREVIYMYGNQKRMAKTTMLSSLGVMYVGLVTTVLFLMRIVPDWMLTVYVFAQMTGIFFYYVTWHIIVDLDPLRIESEAAHTRYDKLVSVTDRLNDEHVETLREFVRDNTESLVTQDVTTKLGRQIRHVERYESALTNPTADPQQYVPPIIITTNDTLPNPPPPTVTTEGHLRPFVKMTTVTPTMTVSENRNAPVTTVMESVTPTVTGVTPTVMETVTQPTPRDLVEQLVNAPIPMCACGCNRNVTGNSKYHHPTNCKSRLSRNGGVAKALNTQETAQIAQNQRLDTPAQVGEEA